MTYSITHAGIQLSIFEDNDLGDLEKVRLVFETVPAAHLLAALDSERGSGRNDNPNLMMWHCVLSMFILQHSTIESFRREMMRNRQLRELVGYQPQIKTVTVQDAHGKNMRIKKRLLAPPASAFTGFLKRLITHGHLLDGVFEALVAQLYEIIPTFGENLIADGKMIETFAAWRSEKSPDGRRDTEATSTAKIYTTTTKNGEKETKKTFYHGYRDHAIVDAETGLPVAHDVRTAKDSEQTALLEMLPNLPAAHQAQCEHFVADRGYDSTKIRDTIEGMGMKPVIDNRKFKRDGMDEWQYKDTDLWYNYKGQFFFEERGALVPMRYMGYDKVRDKLRYTYPVWHPSNEIIRVDRSEDKRHFQQLPFHTPKFKRIYKKRTEVERTFARLDRDLGFENHTIRGRDKMNVFVTLAYIVMNGYAVGKWRQGDGANIRSFRAA